MTTNQPRWRKELATLLQYSVGTVYGFALQGSRGDKVKMNQDEFTGFKNGGESSLWSLWKRKEERRKSTKVSRKGWNFGSFTEKREAIKWRRAYYVRTVLSGLKILKIIQTGQGILGFVLWWSWVIRWSAVDHEEKGAWWSGRRKKLGSGRTKRG